MKILVNGEHPLHIQAMEITTHGMNSVKSGILSQREFYRWDRANSALVFNTVLGGMDDDSTERHAA